MTPANFVDIFDPHLHPVTVKITKALFLFSAFWEHPSPHTVQTLFKSRHFVFVRLPEGREDHGAVVQEDPEAAEAARDDGVLLEPLDDWRGVAARRALQSEAGAVREEGRGGRLRDPERRQEGQRRRCEALICNEKHV